jgi:hypothetical protein
METRPDGRPRALAGQRWIGPTLRASVDSRAAAGYRGPRTIHESPPMSVNFPLTLRELKKIVGAMPDPAAAERLGLSRHQVLGLRKVFAIPAYRTPEDQLTRTGLWKRQKAEEHRKR